MSCESPGMYADPQAQHLLGASGSPRRALFLDRDGVINVDHGYVHTPEQTAFVPGIFELCRMAGAEGYILIVVTNQAGIARGKYSEEEFLEYTRWQHEEFARRGAPLLCTYYCPHHPSAGLGPYLCVCGCRKPAPGMILAAAQRYGIDLAGSALIGDKPGDMMAGHTAGVGTRVLIGDGCDPPHEGAGAGVRTLSEAMRLLF